MIQPKYSQRWTHRIPSQGLHRTSRKRSNQRRSGAACSSLTSDRFGVPGIPGGPVVHIWYTNNIYVYENIPWVILTSEDVYIDVFSLKMLHLFLVKMNKIIPAPLGDRAKPTHCSCASRAICNINWWLQQDFGSTTLRRWHPPQWYCWWKKSCTTKDDDYPIIYRVLTIPGGAGFLPSTLCLDCLISHDFFRSRFLNWSTFHRDFLGGGNSNMFYFHPGPLPGELIQFDEHICQTGWFNHQLVCNKATLQGINISHLGKRKIIFKMPFLGIC